MSVSNDDFASLAGSRAGMYDFLASLCAKPYAKQEVELMKYAGDISSSPLPVDLKSGLKALSLCGPESSETDWETGLQVDWTKLFRGVARGYGPPPPYEYAYHGGSGGGTIWAVRQAYSQQGLEFPLESGESPDFIGVEFKFMSSLASKEAAAWKRGRDEAIRLISSERQFAVEHLRSWVPKYCEEARKMASTPFYKAVIQLIESVVSWDASLLERLEVTASDSL